MYSFHICSGFAIVLQFDGFSTFFLVSRTRVNLLPCHPSTLIAYTQDLKQIYAQDIIY
jgi:hypothetical protein